MPLASHHVDFTLGPIPAFPVGMFSLIGEDGNHYIIVADPDHSGGIAVGCAETDSVIKTISRADFRSDAAGLALSYASTITLNNQCAIPIPGTSQFYLVGVLLGANGVSGHATMLIRYTIIDTSTVAVDGGFLYVTGAHKYYMGGYCWGARLINGQLYAVVDGGTFSPATQTNFMLSLPITGTVNDPTPGSWDVFATDMGAQLPWLQLRPVFSVRSYFNRTSIVNDDDYGVGFYYYWGQSEADADPGYSATPKMWYLGVDTAGRTTGILQDVTSSFGIPFADTHKLYSGGDSSDATDDYTSPSIGATNELIMTRVFSDNKQYFRYRRFSRTSNGTVTIVDNGDAQASAIAVTTGVSFVELYREGDDLNSMLHDARRFIFLGQVLAPPSGSGAYIPKVRHI